MFANKVNSLNSSVKVLTNTTAPLPTQVDSLTSTVEGVRLGQLVLLQVTKEIKGNLSLLRERVEILHSKVDIQANMITALTALEESTAEDCNKTVKLLISLARNQQQQHSSLLTYAHLSNVPYISSNSCPQLAEDYPQGASGYYWVRNGTNNTVSTYCIITSQQYPASSCQELAQDHPQGASGYYWVRIETSNIVSSYCIITSQQNPASSCQQLAEDHPQVESGYYWVKNGTGQPTKVYCDMERHCCNSTGGWIRVAYVDMTDHGQQCPSGLHLRTDVGVRTCGIFRGGCTSTIFPSHGIRYNRVCGRVRAYQYGETSAFINYYYHQHYTIDDWYVDGVSIIYGSSPHQHIWTFAATYSEYYSRSSSGDNWACPCTHTNQTYTGAVPRFIGEDYFCDTAVSAAEKRPGLKLYIDDPLWDGQGCSQNSTCCSFNSPPWFCKQLPNSTTDDIELRMCGLPDSQTPFDHVELLIQ